MGFDYVPDPAVPSAVTVEDIPGGGSAVASDVACGEACDAVPGCNSASYYGNMPEAEWPAAKNCWLKTLGVPCELPGDASAENPLAMLMMKTSDVACTTLQLQVSKRTVFRAASQLSSGAHCSSTSCFQQFPAVWAFVHTLLSPVATVFAPL